jgi:hypothetical protein
MTANKSVTANFGYPLSVVKAGIGLYILKNCLLKSKISNCPTQRAPDGWWAPRFEHDSSEEFSPVSLVGSPTKPLTQAVGRLGLL